MAQADHRQAAADPRPGADRQPARTSSTARRWPRRSPRRSGRTASSARSEMARLPIRCAWIATGNNPAFSNEMARRIVRIRLDARTDQPWRREGFRHPDLMGWVRANRGRLVAACLTLGQAWIAAGRPRGRRSIGSYEAWAQVLGGVLEVAGVDGLPRQPRRDDGRPRTARAARGAASCRPGGTASARRRSAPATSSATRWRRNRRCPSGPEGRPRAAHAPRQGARARCATARSGIGERVVRIEALGVAPGAAVALGVVGGRCGDDRPARRPRRRAAGGLRPRWEDCPAILPSRSPNKARRCAREDREDFSNTYTCVRARAHMGGNGTELTSQSSPTSPSALKLPRVFLGRMSGRIDWRPPDPRRPLGWTGCRDAPAAQPPGRRH